MTKLNNRQIAAFLEFGKGAVEEIIAEELAQDHTCHLFDNPMWGRKTFISFDKNGIITSAYVA